MIPATETLFFYPHLHFKDMVPTLWNFGRWGHFRLYSEAIHSTVSCFFCLCGYMRQSQSLCQNFCFSEQQAQSEAKKNLSYCKWKCPNFDQFIFVFSFINMWSSGPNFLGLTASDPCWVIKWDAPLWNPISSMFFNIWVCCQTCTSEILDGWRNIFSSGSPPASPES